MMKKTTVKTLLVVLSGLFLLGACGQKGPLYIEKSEEEIAAEAAAKADSESTDDSTDSAADNAADEQEDGEAAVTE